jgi:hypothetical protein
MELFRQLPYDIQCSVMRYTPHPCAAIIKADARFRRADDFNWHRPQPLAVFDCCVVYGPPTFNVLDHVGYLLGHFVGLKEPEADYEAPGRRSAPEEPEAV